MQTRFQNRVNDLSEPEPSRKKKFALLFSSNDALFADKKPAARPQKTSYAVKPTATPVPLYKHPLYPPRTCPAVFLRQFSPTNIAKVLKADNGKTIEISDREAYFYEANYFNTVFRINGRSYTRRQIPALTSCPECFTVNPYSSRNLKYSCTCYHTNCTLVKKYTYNSAYEQLFLNYLDKI